MEVAALEFSFRQHTCWNELPPELLVMIIDHLHDPANKLRCRLVNSKWKAAANFSLERYVLSFWTRRNALGDSNEPTFPSMTALPIFDDGPIQPSNFVNCPLEFAKTRGNPFPTKSLLISPRCRCGSKNSKRKSRITVYKLLKNFGIHLTSFHLHGVRVNVLQMNLILKHLENLRALTISSVEIIEQEESTISTVIVAPPPSLQYLRVLRMSGSNFIYGLIDLSANQLISLDVQDFELRPFTQTGEIHPTFRAWRHLTSLKIRSASKEFLQRTTSIPLQNLSVTILSSEQKITLSELIRFLDKFSNTLTTLYLNINLGQSVTMNEKILSNFVRFPFLRKLYLCVPQSETQLEIIEQHMLRKFPNLEYLYCFSNNEVIYKRFQVADEFGIELNSVFNRVGYWQLCPKLKCMIALVKNSLVKYTREMFYLWEFEKVLQSYKVANANL